MRRRGWSSTATPDPNSFAGGRPARTAGPIWSRDINFRVGGTYRYVWRNDENGFEFVASGVWKEIDAPKRIVHTEKMDGFDGESLCTYTLTGAGGRTTLSLTMEFDSEAARDGAVKSGMTDGMAQSYDRLDAVLTETAS